MGEKVSFREGMIKYVGEYDLLTTPFFKFIEKEGKAVILLGRALIITNTEDAADALAALFSKLGVVKGDFSFALSLAGIEIEASDPPQEVPFVGLALGEAVVYDKEHVEIDRFCATPLPPPISGWVVQKRGTYWVDDIKAVLGEYPDGSYCVVYVPLRPPYVDDPKYFFRLYC